MTRKKIRYSELTPPPAAPATPPDAPASLPASSATPADEAETFAPPIAPELMIEPDVDTVELIARGEARELIEPVRFDAATTPIEILEPSERPAAAQAPLPRPKRNSTPVELARTLTAERDAALAEGGEAAGAASGETPKPKAAAQGGRSLREMARRREGTAEMLMFRVGGEHFVVELVLVDEVIDLPVIHHVPEMPPAMIGVVTVRGSLTPVYSPRQALGLPLALRDALLIFRRGGLRVGILIDDVDDAISIDMSELRETAGGDEPDSVLLGVVRLASALIGIVDVDALIAACQSVDILETA